MTEKWAEFDRAEFDGRWQPFWVSTARSLFFLLVLILEGGDG